MEDNLVSEVREEVFDLFNQTIQKGMAYVLGAAERCKDEFYFNLNDPTLFAEHIVFWVSVSLMQMEYGVIDSETMDETQRMLKAYNPGTIALTETEKEELAGMIKEFQEKLPAVKIVSRNDEIPPKEETKHLWGRPFKNPWMN